MGGWTAHLADGCHSAAALEASAECVKSDQLWGKGSEQRRTHSVRKWGENDWSVCECVRNMTSPRRHVTFPAKKKKKSK